MPSPSVLEQEAPAEASGKRLKAYIERLERLDEEIEGLQDDQKDIRAEIKSAGFDVKVVNQIVKRRKLGPQKVQEADELLALYEASIGA